MGTMKKIREAVRASDLAVQHALETAVICDDGKLIRAAFTEAAGKANDLNQLLRRVAGEVPTC